MARERILVVGVLADFDFTSLSAAGLRNWVRANNVRNPIVTDVAPMVRGPSVALFALRDNALVVDLATMTIVQRFGGTTGGGVPAATGIYQAIDDIIARQGGGASDP